MEFIPRFNLYQISSKTPKKPKNYDPTMQASGEAEYKDVVIPYGDEPLAS